MNIYIRQARLGCAHHGNVAEPSGEGVGVMAVAAISGSFKLATLLLVDLDRLALHTPAALGPMSAIDEDVRTAYQLLIAPSGVVMSKVRVVLCDAAGGFDFFVAATDRSGMWCEPIVSVQRGVPARSCDAFLSWTGDTGRQLLDFVARAVPANTATRCTP